MSKQNFYQASYLSQVRNIRKLALSALKQYPVRAESVDFINYGENATFKVTSKQGKKYLLRVHRENYHSKQAIQEELKWLDHLSKTTDLSIPVPVLSKNNHFIEEGFYKTVPNSRYCNLFHWVEGHFIYKSVNPKNIYCLGLLIAKLQKNAKNKKIKHRRYWDADGLVGSNPKFGVIDHLSGVSSQEQRIITQARKKVFSKLKSFEKKFPDRQGLIHADLHFGNFLFQKGHLGAIDFDDCGLGFYGYDLAIPVNALDYIIKTTQKKNGPKLINSIYEGYASVMPFDSNDQNMTAYFIAARKLCMLGWLQSRSDNPRLKKHLKDAVKKAVKSFK